MEAAFAQPDAAVLLRAIEQSRSLVILTDAEANITYVNRRFTEVTGYPRAEVVGRNPRFLQSGRTPGPVYSAMWARLSAGGEWHGELENRRKDGGAYWASVVISAVRDGDGHTTHYLAVQDDVTERRRADAALRRLNHQLEGRVAARTVELEQANRVLERFNRVVVHDLRRALRTITSFVEIVVDDAADQLDTDAQDALARVHASARGAAELIAGLEQLDVVTRDPVERERIDLLPLVETLVAEQTIDPAIVRVDAGAAVSADPRLLRLALSNLLANAVKFSAEADPQRVEVGVDPDGALTVRDNGIGIVPEEAEGLFEWSARGRGSARFAGSGIGLATVRRVAERHGGAVRAELVPGGGALFRLSFGPA